MKKRLLSMALAILMILSMLPTTAFAGNEVTTILSIGDSITTGYGLADANTESFTAQIAAKEGYRVVNKAIDGNTASGITQQLNTGLITDEEIQSADIITITCGGNDMMALLYSKIAEAWNLQYPEDPMTALQVPVELSNPASSRRLNLMMLTLNLMNSNHDMYLMNDSAFVAALTYFAAALNGIVSTLHSKNADAQIIVATQYNPYVNFKNTKYMNFVNLDPIYSGMEAGVTALNMVILANAKNSGYTVADVKAAFDAYTGSDSLYNASPLTLNVDFHPTKFGHRILADTFLNAFSLKQGNESVTECTKDSQCPMYPYSDLAMDYWYHDGVHFCIKHGYLVGMSDTAFEPDTSVTRAMIVAILWRMEEMPTVESTISFSDIADGTWYTDAVRWAASHNIVSGYTQTTFAPDETATREQLAAILYRYEQYKGGGFSKDWTYHMNFSDMKDLSDWAYESMCWMNMHKIILGKTNDLLNPQGKATRAEAANILYRYLQLED